MPVPRILHVEEHAGKLFVEVRWKGLDKSKNTLDQHKRTPVDIRKNVEAALNL